MGVTSIFNRFWMRWEFTLKLSIAKPGAMTIKKTKQKNNGLELEYSVYLVLVPQSWPQNIFHWHMDNSNIATFHDKLPILNNSILCIHTHNRLSELPHTWATMSASSFLLLPFWFCSSSERSSSAFWWPFSSSNGLGESKKYIYIAILSNCGSVVHKYLFFWSQKFRFTQKKCRMTSLWLISCL